MKVMSAQGATKASTFKDVAPGEAVVILTPRGNTNAQTVEIFPLK
jgi:hypothetical protein